MITERPIKRIEFTEQDEEFVKKLSKDIGCGYVKINGRTYTLNPLNWLTLVGSTVFAWVHKEDEGHFWISTRKDWVNQAKRQALMDNDATGMNCFPKHDPSGDSLCFDVHNINNSLYLNTVKALSLVNKARLIFYGYQPSI